MLQKLENAYLAILRFLVIAVASVLLVVVVILGFNSFKAIQFEPVAKEFTPLVSAQELIKGITEDKKTPEAEPAEDKNDTPAKDPNMIFYERAATAIVNYAPAIVNNVNGRNKIVEMAQIIETLKETATALEDPKLVTFFAKGFADSIKKTLKDESVYTVAKITSPKDVCDMAFSLYIRKFNEQIKKEYAEFAAKQQEYVKGKSEGMQSLYIAAGAFITFLMIVFLSIIIKIERNLRHLENKSATTA